MILVVEDEMIVARDIQRQLAALGYECVGHATRGQDAIVLAEELQPNLVLMDIRLAGEMDGIATAQVMHDRFAVPIIFLSASVGDETLARAQRADPFGFLLKPFSERELRMALELAIYKHGAETKLRESDVRTVALLSTIAGQVFINRRDGEFLSVHASDPSALFVGPEMLLYRKVHEVFPAAVGEKFMRAFATALDSHAMQELHYALTFGGQEKYFEARVVPSAADTVISIIHDVTTRKEVETRLRLQSVAFEASANAMVITNRAGTIEWANTAFLLISGYTLKEVIGGSPGRLLKSGKHDAAFYRAMWDTISAGNVWQGEVINRRRDGALFTEEMTVTPIRQENGEITHFIAVKQDITQRKSLEAQLLQSQKMEAIGLLAGGVAHDFNNILAAVLMYLGMLQQEPGLGRDTRSALNGLEKEVTRGASLTRQLLAFSRQQVMKPSTFNLNLVVVNLMKMLRRLLGENLKISHAAPQDVLLAEVDEGMFEQVVINLCINARDAMPRGGQLKIAIKPVAITINASHARADARPGRFLCLEVTDTGCGMDDVTIQRAFEPFFTTKEEGKGTGLGLAIVHGIVKQHRGWIEVKSEVGRGTTFRVFFPESEELELKIHKLVAPGKCAAGAGETILLAEDEVGLRNVVGLVLRQNGYEVLEATDGTHAIDQWQKRAGRIDLLITDLIMPGKIDGLELVEKFHLDDPALNVVVCTGYVHEASARQLAENPRITVLNKPFNLPLLLATVRQAIDRN